MYGNASLSVYDKIGDTVYNEVYYNVNGKPLGDVCQSMKVIDNKGFIVVNNSGKVTVVDMRTMKYLGVIKGLSSPRYVEQINADKIYITDLGSRYITIANPKTLDVTGTINVGRTTEQMARWKNHIYTSSWSYGKMVYKIDHNTDQVTDSLEVTYQPNSIVADKNGKIWVLSDGGYQGNAGGHVNACLTKIDASSFTIEARFEFENKSLSPSEVTINPSGEKLFFLCGGYGSSGGKNGVFSMGVNDTKLPETPFIAESGSLFYALGIDPYNGDVYVSDAIDYAQKGYVMRYNEDAKLIKKISTGISSGAFCFFSL